MMTPSLGMEKNLKLRWMKMLEEYSDFSLFLADFTPDLKIIEFTQFPSHLKKLTFNREAVGHDEIATKCC